MRIITGSYKGRHFDIPRTFKARPTTDFAKENIFNVLRGYVDFDGITALDLFAGTGSISLELVSRGCKQVISVEADRDHADFIRRCFAKLGDDRDVLVRGDVFRFLKRCRQQFDFIFADPPFRSFPTSFWAVTCLLRVEFLCSSMAKTMTSPPTNALQNTEVTAV